MSANNWMECPKCKRDLAKEREDAIADAKSQYGKVSEAEYRELLQDAESLPEIEKSLREDWEIGLLDGGEFFMRYAASCTRCGWEWSHPGYREQVVN